MATVTIDAAAELPSEDSMKLVAARGAPISNADAETIGRELLKIRERKGRLLPEDVLAESKKRNSPLAKYFPETESEAAQKFFLAKARSMIGWVRLEVVVERQVQQVRVFNKVTVVGADNAKSSDYVTIQSVASSEQLTEQVRARALAELKQWFERYRAYKSVLLGGTGEFVDAVGELLAREQIAGG